MERKSIDITKMVEEDIVALAEGGQLKAVVQFYSDVVKRRVAFSRRYKELYKALNYEPRHLTYVIDQLQAIENVFRKALKVIADVDPSAKWAASMPMSGFYMPATLAAYLDISQTPHPANWLSYAGYGKKNSYNRTLKTSLYMWGQSLPRKKHPYYSLFKRRYAYEWGMNISGKLSSKVGDYSIGRGVQRLWVEGRISRQVAEDMMEKGFVATVSEYEERYGDLPAPGTYKPMLPPGIILARAKAWTKRLFLTHFYEVAHYFRKKQRYDYTKMYAFVYLGHDHTISYIEPPLAPWAASSLDEWIAEANKRVGAYWQDWLQDDREIVGEDDEEEGEEDLGG